METQMNNGNQSSKVSEFIQTIIDEFEKNEDFKKLPEQDKYDLVEQALLYYGMNENIRGLAALAMNLLDEDVTFKAYKTPEKKKEIKRALIEAVKSIKWDDEKKVLVRMAETVSLANKFFEIIPNKQIKYILLGKAQA